MPERLGNLTYLARKEKPEFTFSSLDGLQEHFIHLYARRNDIYLPGRATRIDLLHRGIADLNDAIRKEANREVLERMLARVVSRTFCIAHGTNNISVAEGLRKKFPLEGCSYCHKFPCQCGEKRPAPELGWGETFAQEGWSLKDWQNHLNKLYGEKNREKGIDYIVNRLGSESGELISLEHDILDSTMDDIEQEYQLELADSLAWTIAAANFFGIDIEKATINKYGKGCEKCGSNPCNCGPHSFKQVRGF